jgi:hypothetical protein
MAKICQKNEKNTAGLSILINLNMEEKVFSLAIHLQPLYGTNQKQLEPHGIGTIRRLPFDAIPRQWHFLSEPYKVNTPLKRFNTVICIGNKKGKKCFSSIERKIWRVKTIGS